jgi:hypothetical protein
MLGKKNNASQLPIIAQLLGLVGLLCMQPTTLSAQQPSQTFVVTVPTTAAVVAPPGVSITHDASDAPQDFPGQLWSVNGNSASGMVVEFSVDQAFTHLTQPLAKRDAELSVKIYQTEGPARWTATKAIDATSCGQGDEHAVVQVTSDSFGTAEIDLGVRFLSNGTTALATGDYATTVFCTITMP